MKIRYNINLSKTLLIALLSTLIIIVLFSCSYEGLSSDIANSSMTNPPIKSILDEKKQESLAKEKDDKSDNEYNKTDETLTKKLNKEDMLKRIIPVAIILGVAIVLFLIIGITFGKLQKTLTNKLNSKKVGDKQDENLEPILSLIITIIRFGIFFVAIIISLNILNLISLPKISATEIINWLVTSGVNIAVTIFAMYVFLKLTSVIIDRLKISIALRYKNTKSLTHIDKAKKSETLGKLTGYLLRLIIWVTGVITILGQLSINIIPIIASAGIIGIAIGFGSQSLIKDILQGAFILIENQFRVGDVIIVAGVTGIVEDFNIRYTRIRNLSGSVYFVPNGEIKVVENVTKEWSRAMIDISVAYKEDVDKVMDVIKQVGDALLEDENYKEVLLEPMDVLGVEHLGESGVTIKNNSKNLTTRAMGCGKRD